MNAGGGGVRNMTVVFERREGEVVDFDTPYRVNVPAVGNCEVLIGEKWRE